MVTFLSSSCHFLSSKMTKMTKTEKRPIRPFFAVFSQYIMKYTGFARFLPHRFVMNLKKTAAGWTDGRHMPGRRHPRDSCGLRMTVTRGWKTDRARRAACGKNANTSRNPVFTGGCPGRAQWLFMAGGAERMPPNETGRSGCVTVKSPQSSMGQEKTQRPSGDRSPSGRALLYGYHAVLRWNDGFADQTRFILRSNQT